MDPPTAEKKTTILTSYIKDLKAACHALREATEMYHKVKGFDSETDDIGKNIERIYNQIAEQLDEAESILFLNETENKLRY